MATLTWLLFQTPDDVLREEEVTVQPEQRLYAFTAAGLVPGLYHLQVYEDGGQTKTAQQKKYAPRGTLADEQVFHVSEAPLMRVALDRGIGEEPLPTDPLATYDAFRAYLEDEGGPEFGAPRQGLLTYTDDTYEDLKRLSRAFVKDIKVTSLEELARPYLRSRRNNTAFPLMPPVAFGFPYPGIELIWNFWEEAGMFVQTLNLILARFQNRVAPGGRYSPLDRFDTSPLATLHALLYAFVDDEQHRMTVRRRAAEYEYEYGMRLIGRAIPPSASFVERRSAFLESFHQVLHQAHVYFKEDDDLTVNADAFPLYRSLRECHLELSQGSHNQYGQLAISARAEFLQMQFVLSQPEMRLFLGGRPMTPYSEAWMEAVDRMKEIQPGWPTASVMHFHDLATIGERLVLTIRLGSWADPSVNSAHAKGWADALREPIQKYVAAYRAVTGVDLSMAPDATQPATLILERVTEQRARA
ncbi:MAG: hypothetical protein ACLGHZ_04630 [Actinomycetes bacterium]